MTSIEPARHVKAKRDAAGPQQFGDRLFQTGLEGDAFAGVTLDHSLERRVRKDEARPDRNARVRSSNA